MSRQLKEPERNIAQMHSNWITHIFQIHSLIIYPFFSLVRQLETKMYCSATNRLISITLYSVIIYTFISLITRFTKNA